MLTQPLSGTDSVISVSSPSAFPLAVVGEDVSKRQTVFSPLSTPHPCTFSSPSAPNSHTPVPPSIHPPTPSSVSLSTPLFVSPQSASTLPPLSTLPFSVSSTFSLPPFSATASPAAPHSPVICSTSSSPSPSVSSALHHLLPPPPPPSCCPCSSILPRLLSAHRMEVRRLLRGALSSLGRRLDSLERKSKRKKRRRIRQASEDPAAFPCSCSPAPISPLDSSSSSPSSFSTSLSSHREDSCKSKQSKNKQGEEKVTLRKRSRNTCGVEGEEEEDTGRFVGQMAVSFTRRRGDTEGKSLLTLHDFSHREEQGGSSQSDKAVKQNYYSSTSHPPLHCLQSAQSDLSSIQSEAACVSSVQWDFTSLRSSHTFSHRQLCGSSFSPTPMLLLSSVAMETVSKLLRVGACGSPLWPLKDWTAPPSLMSDHCYVRLLTPSATLSTVKGQKKQLTNDMDQSLPLPQGWPPPLPPCSANGLFAPLPASQSATDSSFLSTNAKRSKRVSQIRIRRATPRETQLTPMGLPKIRRLKKKEFSLEEIYTNKNYNSPTTNRSLETIFEEPREKDGALLLIGQQKRRRLLLFPDFTQPRKRKKPQGPTAKHRRPGFPVAVVPRKRAARRHCHGDSSCDDSVDLDVMLVERLSELEDFLTQQGLDV